MGAAVDDVHHRHRKHPALDAADVAVERQAGGLGGGLGHGERDAEDGVGTQPSLVRRAVEGDHRLVDRDLILGIHAADRVEDLVLHRLDGLEHALAVVAALVAVAQLDRLVGAGRGARGHGGAAERTVLEKDIDLDGGVAAAVENLAGGDVGDRGHGRSCGCVAAGSSRGCRRGPRVLRRCPRRAYPPSVGCRQAPGRSETLGGLHKTCRMPCLFARLRRRQPPSPDLRRRR